MELEELKTLAAASLLSTVAAEKGGSRHRLGYLDREDIERAVRMAQTIWEEVLRQERER